MKNNSTVTTDYFAGLAMQAMLNNKMDLKYTNLELIAQNAYKMADLMIVERSKE